ncbi:hypothetical protein [Sphingomonas aerophila]|uniref:Putative membrane protein n=1 Tax=Sphingomonas aerophila TaxID=1344948 RepID=A0A7W9EX02_9SPHN|nr:hypothetical protein [Sphingomonas aerophila]MBB5716257.1 putative membrane protein [Sphingomonas aerophila]
MTAAIDRADALSRRRALMMPFLAVLLLAQQSLFWNSDWRAVSIVQLAAWTVIVVVMLWALVTGGGFLLPRDVRALANDEVTEANRAIAIRRGFVASILTAMIVFAASPFEPITAQRAAHLIVSLGLAITLLSFGLLERKSLD